MVAQFIRYAIVGAVNTVLDFGIYAGLTRGFEFWKHHYLLANGTSFIIIVTWSFFLNKCWTFRNREARHASQYLKFLIITLMGMGIAESVLYLGVEIFSAHDVVAKILATPLVVVWNFFAYRFWAFRVSGKEKSA